MHRWQLLVRCEKCGFQQVVERAAARELLREHVAQMTLTAQRIINRSDVKLPPCKECK